MTLTILALIPVIVLLVYIYRKDKMEKEPKRLLLSCFLWGVISVFPIILAEDIVEFLISLFVEEETALYAIFDGFIVAGLTEEFFKRFFLTRKTWKNKNFDCMFDGVVYSVFVTLGFAAFENILYVLDGDISIALLRMGTAVPGHMCFAVFMGFFYSKAKLAYVNDDKAKYRKNKKLALLIPVLLHGIYDSLIMVQDYVSEDSSSALMCIWMIYLIVLFVFTFTSVNRASKGDEYIIRVGSK